MSKTVEIDKINEFIDRLTDGSLTISKALKDDQWRKITIAAIISGVRESFNEDDTEEVLGFTTYSQIIIYYDDAEKYIANNKQILVPYEVWNENYERIIERGMKIYDLF